MDTLHSGQFIVQEGTYLYAGTVECEIRIVFSPIRYGTGDYEDPPENANDLECSAYYVQYGSATQRGIFNSGGGSCLSLAEAIASAEAAPGIGSSVRWRSK
jgi:hypothetical protein